MFQLDAPVYWHELRFFRGRGFVELLVAICMTQAASWALQRREEVSPQALARGLEVPTGHRLH